MKEQEETDDEEADRKEVPREDSENGQMGQPEVRPSVMDGPSADAQGTPDWRQADTGKILYTIRDMIDEVITRMNGGIV